MTPTAPASSARQTCSTSVEPETTSTRQPALTKGATRSPPSPITPPRSRSSSTRAGGSVDDLTDECLAVAEVGDRAVDALEPERQRQALGEQLVVVDQHGAGQGAVGPGGVGSVRHASRGRVRRGTGVGRRRGRRGVDALGRHAHRTQLPGRARVRGAGSSRTSHPRWRDPARGRRPARRISSRAPCRPRPEPGLAASAEATFEGAGCLVGRSPGPSSAQVTVTVPVVGDRRGSGPGCRGRASGR